MPNIPAGEIEQLVKSEIYGLLKGVNKLQPHFTNRSISKQKSLLNLASKLKFEHTENERIFTRSFINKIVLSDSKVTITLCADNLLKSLELIQQDKPNLHNTSLETEKPITITRNVKLVQANNGSKIIAGSIANGYNMQLIKAITKSFLWHEQLINGEVGSLVEIQKRENLSSKTYLDKIMRLRFLSPEIIEPILNGINSSEWTVEKLFKIKSLD